MKISCIDDIFRHINRSKFNFRNTQIFWCVYIYIYKSKFHPCNQCWKKPNILLQFQYCFWSRDLCMFTYCSCFWNFKTLTECTQKLIWIYMCIHVVWGYYLAWGLGLLLCKPKPLHDNQHYQVPCRCFKPPQGTFHFFEKNIEQINMEMPQNV